MFDFAKVHIEAVCAHYFLFSRVAFNMKFIFVMKSITCVKQIFVFSLCSNYGKLFMDSFHELWYKF